MLIRKIGHTAQPSKIQAANQLLDGAAQLAGHVLEAVLQALSQELAVDVPRNPRRASNSCLT